MIPHQASHSGSGRGGGSSGLYGDGGSAGDGAAQDHPAGAGAA